MHGWHSDCSPNWKNNCVEAKILPNAKLCGLVSQAHLCQARIQQSVFTDWRLADSIHAFSKSFFFLEIFPIQCLEIKGLTILQESPLFVLKSDSD